MWMLTVECVITGLVVTILATMLHKNRESRSAGMGYTALGLAFVVLGLLFDITDNFSGLDEYVVIGNTVYQQAIRMAVYAVGAAIILRGVVAWASFTMRLARDRQRLTEELARLTLGVEERVAQPLVGLWYQLEGLRSVSRADPEVEAIAGRAMDMAREVLRDTNGLVEEMSPYRPSFSRSPLLGGSAQ